MIREIIFLFVLGLCFGCQKADRDPVEPLLPEYSERGVNAAGCIYNNAHAWSDICSDNIFYDDCQYLTITYDSTNAVSTINILGELYGLEQPILIQFKLNNIAVQSESDLVALEGDVIHLDGISAVPNLGIYNDFTEHGLLNCQTGEVVSNGQLHIRKAAVLGQDGSKYFVFAGTFGFDLNSPCWEYSMYHGRFDYRVTRFYSN